eukprot:COSAG04_NODE_193_length_20833_cov_9.922205_12_plen_310_part_00
MFGYSATHMAPPSSSPAKQTAQSLIYPCYSERCAAAPLPPRPPRSRRLTGALCESSSDQLRRMGKKPKDHHRANLRRLREMGGGAGARRSAEAPEADAAAETYRVPSAYRDVASKVNRPSTAPPGGRAFLRAGSKNPVGPPAKSDRPYTARARTKPRVPRAADARTIEHAPKDCMQANIENIAVLESQKNEEKAAAAAPAPPPDWEATYGKVPRYLANRQAEAQAEAQAAKDAAAAARQPGVLLSEDERLGMLHEMQAAFAAKSVELQRMPMLVSTMGQRSRKSALERDLDELEKGIRRFSNPKVFVSR